MSMDSITKSSDLLFKDTLPLELHEVLYGSSSDTFDFDYVCVRNKRRVPGGRLAFAILKMFYSSQETRIIRWGHGYPNRDQMYAYLKRFSE